MLFRQLLDKTTELIETLDLGRLQHRHLSTKHPLGRGQPHPAVRQQASQRILVHSIRIVIELVDFGAELGRQPAHSGPHHIFDHARADPHHLGRRPERHAFPQNSNRIALP